MEDQTAASRQTMASQQDIKRRIRSVKNTQKITKAMELVAASRLRRAQARIVALRPYADRMQSLTVEIAQKYGAGRSAALGEPRAGRERRHHRDCRRPRARPAPSTPTWSGARSSSPASTAPGPRRALAQRRPQWRINAAIPPPDDRPGVHRPHRSPQVRKRQGDRHPRGRLVQAGEIDQVMMVYHHFLTALSQRLDVVELLPVPEEILGAEQVGCRSRAPIWRSRTAARFWPSCCPRTSRSRSSARCWSRPRPSTGRA